MYQLYKNVAVLYPDEMPEEEALSYVDEELTFNPKATLTKMEIELSADGENVQIQPYYDTISRVRRITGYLSTIPKFNEAKKAEARDRVAHINL